MAQIPEFDYPGKVKTASTAYPYGQAQDVTGTGLGDGTPLRAKWVNDVWGFLQALLKDANIAPTGDADTALESQYLQAIKAVIAADAPRTTVTGSTGQSTTAAVSQKLFTDHVAANPKTVVATTTGTSTTAAVSQKLFTDQVTTTANASSRKVGIATGNLVERGSDGYPTNNNAIGVGQTWRDVKSSRSTNVTYTNSTGRAIMVYVYFSATYNGDAFFVNGVATMSCSQNAGTSGQVIVPPGGTYKSIINALSWSELR